MSQLFGPVHQLGYVVRDIDAAMRHWTQSMHIGPFYYIDHVPLAELRYRGEPGRLETSVALTYSGDLQIALIQQRNDAPSVYRSFLDAGGEGLHHLGFLSDQYDSDLQRARESGMSIDQSGIAINTGARFAYFSCAGHPGTMLKITSLGEGNRDLYRMIQKEARRWDGSGPIRRVEV